MSSNDLKEKEEKILGDIADDFSPEEQARFGELAQNDEPGGGFYKPTTAKVKNFAKSSLGKKVFFGGGGLGLHLRHRPQGREQRHPLGPAGRAHSSAPPQSAAEESG